LNNVRAKTHIFGTLDGIRGIAALLVLVRHVPFFGGWEFQQSYLAVDLFFILSGVVISNAYQERLKCDLSPIQFIWMRIVRIYPLYLLGCAITGVYWITMDISPVGHPVVIAISALFLIPNVSGQNSPFPLNGPAWSLFSEMLANVVYGFSLRWLSRSALLAIAGVAALWITLVLYRNGSLNFGYNARDIVPGLCRVAYFFSAGILIWKLFCARGLQRYSNLIGAQFVPWIVLVIVALILIASPHGTMQAIFDFVCVTALFPALILVAMIFNPGKASAPIFKFLGLVSYPVYVLHVPLAKWIPIVLRDTGVNLSSQPLWVGIGFIAFLLPLSWVLDRYYDMPIRRRALALGLHGLDKLGQARLITVRK